MNIAENPIQSRHSTVPQHEAEVYNYDRFHPRTLAEDVKLVRHPQGPHLGDPAPDFVLEDTEGRKWRLSDLRGKPVVLVIGSGTCPLTQGNLPALQELYDDYQDRSTWLMLYVREAHPGENMPGHKSYEQKRSQANYFKSMTGTSWPIMVDELDGRVHKDYGLLPNSTFLIDADGNVSFIGEISHAPTLRKALDHLFDQNMRGVVPEGDDKKMHMLGPTAFGWEALQRGGKTSMKDVAKRMPPLAMNLWMGDKMKSMLAPVAARSTPLKPEEKFGMALVAITLGAAVAGFARSRRKRSSRESY